MHAKGTYFLSNGNILSKIKFDLIIFSFNNFQRILEEQPIEPRLITVTTTITSSVYATSTATQGNTQTLKFSSAGNTDCLPRSMLASISVSAC